MRKAPLIIFVLMICAATVSAQSISVKKEIAVFNLGYYDFTIPGGALGLIDDQIRNVFINLGRFEVIGMTHRLSERDVNDFIDKIKAYKEQTLVIPQGVSLGKEIFTEADFNRLTGSFIVVIPCVSFYNAELENNARYKVTIRTSFAFVDVAQAKTIGSATVETSAIHENPTTATRMASDDVPMQLEYEIRKMDAFKLKSGIIDVDGGTVTIEFGKNMGVKAGDEYVIVSKRTIRAGYETEDETGLLLIREVRENFSLASILYSDSKPAIGDQIKEVPRFGLDITGYGAGVLGENGTVVTFGLRTTLSRGSYSLRPLVDLEIPLSPRLSTGSLNYVPLNIFLGAEFFNLYLGRLQLSPSIAGGAGGVIPTYADATAEDYMISHMGFKAQMNLNYLVTRDIKVFGTAGYQFMWGLTDTYPGYNGLMIGFGITYKS